MWFFPQFQQFLLQMLKHVHISPLRNRSDSISLRSSSSSSSCASSICGSPEPPNDSHTRTPSRASSYSSLNESVPQVNKKKIILNTLATFIATILIKLDMHLLNVTVTNARCKWSQNTRINKREAQVSTYLMHDVECASWWLYS